jgi:hypothetical protein
MSSWFSLRDLFNRGAKSVPRVLDQFPYLLALVGLLYGWPAAAAPHWQTQYFYDENSSSLTINDLVFLSAQRGIAVGFVSEGKGAEKIRPMTVVTNDGGAHWSLVPTKEVAASVFFLNDTLGWMVTQKGIWQSDEGGRSWRKLPASPKDMLRVCFVDEQHGWAVGMQKSAFQTSDGGKTWSRLDAAAKPETTPKYTVYATVQFVGKDVGMITGWSQRPRSDEDLPDWMDPGNAAHRLELPHLSISLDTRDGGKTWVPSTTSMFGHITRVRMLPGGAGLGLIEFADSFHYPAELFQFDMRSGKSSRVFREQSRAVTDVALLPDGSAYLAAVEVPGRVRISSLPNKLKILYSNDLASWREMEVDYRANARRATLAVVNSGNLWVATDTGMILKLVQ